ncbi:MAG: EAL domain-containing protein [Clostridia bacterium]|nr:EAL domain-containing protein [Clostridia bacterium]
MKIQEEGEDFFAAAWKNAGRLIHPEDRNRVRLFLDRDHLISQLDSRRQLTEDYRMVIKAGRTQYTRMTVTYSSDHSHFIICVENREEDVRREKEHLAALSMANQLARRDELTGTKNKTAYHETEKELKRLIDEGGDPFGIVVCDINGLKHVNDTEGHKAGDDFIKSACRLVCRVFHHSPVFRIGGDEFVAVLRGQDFASRESLVAGLRRQVEENIRIGEGPVIASGLAEFQPNSDRSVEDVFNRADNQMYEEKARLKREKLLQESHSYKEKANIRMISEERRLLLDGLFRSFEVVADGTYVYLCDMKYDFSRWSKNAVDTFGLPSEYMYGAGDIWENRIHPEDRSAYHKGIDDIFSGNAAGHDMQYRAMRVTGEYEVCTCRGVVIRDLNGEPDYFAGTIRNHGVQGHIDALTGLRNQYGFFEDLDVCIKRNTEISVVLFGISRFSEINEMYGYHFGNRVLQRYARKVFENTGNKGHAYRIDGTKFAVISNTLSVAEMQEYYDRFRAFLHEDFEVDGRKILLDLHCGALRVDRFDVDSQTVYACLNFANEESKFRQQGNLVEFQNDLNEENHQRLEKLHAIRASIMRGNEGFYLLYQPVVDAKTEKLIGAEALLRWKNEQYGTVPPDQFIPLLESDPLFPELGEWIIRESVLAAKRILVQNPGFVVNVNLSYTQIEKPDFVDMVLRILNELEYPPEHLCFEVTERCRLLDLELLKNVIINLKSRGVLVALDDFGTGFSSIGILKEIPFDIIKIDRSFVRRIEENDIDRRLIRNIADLAMIFSAKVCVEGIETEGMRDILKRFHVESFQGYYYARPLLIGDFIEGVGSRGCAQRRGDAPIARRRPPPP